jgi:hypothetical protein
LLLSAGECGTTVYSPLGAAHLAPRAVGDPPDVLAGRGIAVAASVAARRARAHLGLARVSRGPTSAPRPSGWVPRAATPRRALKSRAVPPRRDPVAIMPPRSAEKRPAEGAPDPPPRRAKRRRWDAGDDPEAPPAPPPPPPPAPAIPAAAPLPSADALAKAKAVLKKQKEALAAKLASVAPKLEAADAAADAAANAADAAANAAEAAANAAEAARKNPPPAPALTEAQTAALAKAREVAAAAKAKIAAAREKAGAGAGRAAAFPPPPPSKTAKVQPRALRLNANGDEIDEDGNVVKTEPRNETSTFKVNARSNKLDAFAAAERAALAEAANEDEAWADPRVGAGGRRREKRTGFRVRADAWSPRRTNRTEPSDFLPRIHQSPAASTRPRGRVADAPRGLRDATTPKRRCALGAGRDSITRPAAPRDVGTFGGAFPLFLSGRASRSAGERARDETSRARTAEGRAAFPDIFSLSPTSTQVTLCPEKNSFLVAIFMLATSTFVTEGVRRRAGRFRSRESSRRTPPAAVRRTLHFYETPPAGG